MEKKLKKFDVKCTLIDPKTKKWTIQDIVIEGYNGNDAIANYRKQLMNEGKYKLENYRYFERKEIL